MDSPRRDLRGFAAARPSRNHDAVIKVVIADDHPLVRFAVRRSLEAEDDLEVLGEGRTGQEAVDLTRTLRPDAVVLDYQMPVMDGMSAARIISREQPGVRILMLTAEEDPVIVEEATRAGIHGFVPKADPAEILPRTLRDAVADHPEDVRVVVDPDGARDHSS
jgi:DNA-binding NarL/FixJ family response regulator